MSAPEVVMDDLEINTLFATACGTLTTGLVEAVRNRIGAETDRREVGQLLGLRSDGRRFFCPFCQDDGKPHSTPDLSVEAGWKCHKCNWSGDAFDLVQKVRGVDFGASVRILAGILNVNAGQLPASASSGGGRRKRKGSGSWATLKAAAAAVCMGLSRDGVPFKLSGLWAYGPAAGVARFDSETRKEYRPFHRDGEVWRVGAPPGPRPLYRADTLPASGLVFVVEGEKCADRVAELGLAVVTSAGGARAARKSDWSVLAGRDVVVLPDNDAAGRAYAADVARLCSALNPPARVRVCEPFAGADGYDVGDWAGDRDGVAPESLAAELLALAEAAPLWTGTAAKAPVSSKTATVSDGLPAVCSLGDLVAPCANDDSELLRSRFLCRGGSLLLAGPTGAGKSSFAMQSAIMWALGRPFFGIEPARPLRALMIQGENDAADLREQRDGVLGGLNLTSAERRAACEAVSVATEDTRTREQFAAVLDGLLCEHRVDLVIIDPLLTYLGGDASAQRDVSPFLRNMLNPVIHRHNVGLVLVHHVNKPLPGEKRPQWQAGDYAYLGAGSAEFANWARAVLVLRSIGSDTVFELRLSKRGRRAGWRDAQGCPTLARFVAHSEGVVCWRDARPEEIPPEVLDGKARPARRGRPLADYCPAALAAIGEKVIPVAAFQYELSLIAPNRDAARGLFKSLTEGPDAALEVWRTPTFPARLWVGKAENVARFRRETVNPELPTPRGWKGASV